MRKSLINGTKEDVIKRRNKQSTAKPVHVVISDRAYDNNGKRVIVTYNHPCLGE